MSDNNEDYYSDVDEDETVEQLLAKLSNFEAKKRGRPSKDAHNKNDAALFQVLAGLNKSVKNIERGIMDINKNMESIMKQVSKIENDMLVVTSDQAQMKTEIANLESRVEFFERAFKEKQLLFSSNFLALDNKNASQIEKSAKQCLKNKLAIDESLLKDIDIRRLGKVGNTVLLSFPSLHIKRELFKALKGAREDHKEELKATYLNEFLTKKNGKLMKELRAIKKNSTDRLYAVFSLYGDVYVKYTENGDKCLIRNISDLRD